MVLIVYTLLCMSRHKRGVIGLYILIDLEIHTVYINPSKIFKFSNSLGLTFTNPEIFPRIWTFVFLTKKSMQIHSNTL